MIEPPPTLSYHTHHTPFLPPRSPKGTETPELKTRNMNRKGNFIKKHELCECECMHMLNKYCSLPRMH